MNLGERIYQLRSERNLSQGDLADALEVSRQSVSKWETNASVPELDKLIKMSQLFGISLDELVLNKYRPERQEPQVIYEERAKNRSPRKISGAILLCVAAVVWLLVSLFGDMAVGILLALPFVACGLICLLVPVHPGLLCAWTVYLLVELYLRFATGVNWYYVFVPQLYSGLHTAHLMVAWGLFAVYVLLLTITVWRFRKGTTDRLKRNLTVTGISWAVYFLGGLINIPPYTGNDYDISSMMLYRLVTTVTNWVRNIVLVVAILFTARLVVYFIEKHKKEKPRDC